VRSTRLLCRRPEAPAYAAAASQPAPWTSSRSSPPFCCWSSALRSEELRLEDSDRSGPLAFPAKL
jgi:hypothetical protein